MHKNIVLIGNYAPDKQESMERFTQMLKRGIENSGINVTIWYPVIFFGRLAKTTTNGFGKWLGYLDKWILFPVLLRLRVLKSKGAVYYHICDHSNSPYVNPLPKQFTSITCHDVLAIRGALGFKDAYCPATSTGKILQQWILKNLLKVNKIAAVSQFTLDQLIDLNKGQSKPGWEVIHNGFNAGFTSLTEPQWVNKLKAEGVPQLTVKPYILHVGSNLQRKNRKMLLEMTAALGDKWDGLVCFAGQPMNDKLLKLAGDLKLNDRVVVVKKPSHEYLEALINGAQAFVFPSFSEGFGWPVTEAQACGTPVIASNLAPMPEVGGYEGAVYVDPYNPQEFAAALLRLQDTQYVTKLNTAGFANIKRFDTSIMIKAYLKMFN